MPDMGVLAKIVAGGPRGGWNRSAPVFAGCRRGNCSEAAGSLVFFTGSFWRKVQLHRLQRIVFA